MITKIEKLENDLQDLYGLYPPDERDADWHDLQETLVSEIREEIEAVEVIAKYTAEELEGLRAYGASATREALKPETRRYSIDPEHISWIGDESEILISRRTTPKGKTFWLGSITELSGRTSVVRDITRQEGKLSEVSEIVAGQIAVKLDDPAHRNRALRRLTQEDETTRHTIFNPYSGDAVNPTGSRRNQIRIGLLEDSQPGDRIVPETDSSASQNSTKKVNTEIIDEPVYLLYAIVKKTNERVIYDL